MCFTKSHCVRWCKQHKNKKSVKFEVLRIVNIKSAVFREVTLGKLVNGYQHLGETAFIWRALCITSSKDAV
jgi:hypothetical protein